MKFYQRLETCPLCCRSREGAWIEIIKFSTSTTISISRSREGAWIEIITLQQKVSMSFGRSREGAWIEIRNMVGFSVLLTQITHSD